ncbi:DUF1284 domain-containing protein [Treponema sp. OMZ 840]|uniref:DUF1284 domain-containing protein n=1 Tax=Treponema sp. OMZ 840 TaxID=244313 RepID=UPI003D928FBF
MRAFRGHGYSPSFVNNMHTVIARIKKEGRLEIISGCDDICSSCPHLIQDKAGGEEFRDANFALCDGEEKITAIDANVCAFLGISEGFYTCSELERKVKSELTEAAFEVICAPCEWKQRGVCTYEVVYGRS